MKAKFIGSKVIVYSVRGIKPRKPDRLAAQLEKARQNRFKGALSFRSKAMIYRRFNGWFQSALVYNKTINSTQARHQKRFVLITLTLPAAQDHGDKFIKTYMLNPFMKRLRKNHNVTNYMWKAETQKNGNIHFHIVIDVYVSYADLRSMWLFYMKKFGYIDRFNKANPGKQAPCINVVGQKTMKNPVNYICKYMTKNNESRLVNGSLFRFSESLLDVDSFETVTDAVESERLLTYCWNNCSSKYIQKHFSIFTFKSLFDLRYISINLYKQEQMYYNTLARTMLYADLFAINV